MISFRKKAASGFTIIELLIVIVVIGILATLVIVTYNGIQSKARDTKRKTDINALHGQLEAYQAENGKYPTLANMQDRTWISTNMKGLDLGALQDPKWSTSAACKNTATPPEAILNGTASADCYVYAPNDGNGNACDNAGTDCIKYTLNASLEDGTTYTQNSLQ
ncbi:MAG TPA: type II secretion system protein [Candidatus Binatia bacterium]|nr:type II secretion system protein [Candidatus Binatia bacterium]